MTKFFLLSTVFFYCLQITYSQSGQLDPSFANKGIAKTDMGSPFDYNSFARQVLIRPDGSIYIVLDATYISKRFPDGSIDSSYGLDGYSSTVPLGDNYAALQPDGKIVIAGSASSTSFGLARLNTNGMPDSTFGNTGMQTIEFDGHLYPKSLAIQSDGKIVVAGYNITSNNDTYFAVARFNTDGSADETFNGSGQQITDFGFKLPPDIEGEVDSVEVHYASANTVAIQADSKIVVGGFVFTGYDIDFAIARYNTDGSLDSTFDNDGRQTTDFGSSYDAGNSLAIQSNGKIVLAGLTNDGIDNHLAVIRYNINGSLDGSFNGNGKQTANLISDITIGNWAAIQSDGKIVVAGYSLTGSNNDFAVARFNTDGSPDNTFDNDGILTTDFTFSDDYAGSVAIQSDDKIVVAGVAYTYSLDVRQRFALTRYDANGSLDNSFDNDGKLEEDYKQGHTEFYATSIQTDGKIVAAGLTWNGSNYDFATTRYNANGSIDSTFSDDGKQTTDFGSYDDYAYSMAIQKDGKIIVAGTSNSQFAIARYNTDGSPDNTFNGNGKNIIPIGFADVCQSVALQSDGKIVMAGYTFTDPNYDSADFAIARFNTNGTPDNTFGQGGKQLTDISFSQDFATSVAIQNDGKIVVAGRSYLNNNDNFSLARYNSDGSPDTTFSHDGKQNNLFGPDDYFGESLAIQKDGKIVVAGFSQTPYPASTSFAVARYKTNGELDNTFSDDGFQTTYPGVGTSVAINNDGTIAVGGSYGNYAVVLYKNDGSPDSAFSDDGIQTTNISASGSSIQSLAFAGNKLYAVGYGDFPGTLGVVARYLLAEGGPLPVSLLDFKAVLQNKSVVLQWKIATEKNLTWFVIERSADGNRFLPINSLTVLGVSTFTRDYSIMDEQPLQGINFYRLKIVDADGKFTYSNIVAVKINTDNKLQIFPNPAKRILFVEANGNNENAVVQIVDIGGRKLKEMKVFLNGKTSFSVDISNLSQGIYNLILHKKEKTEVQTFIKK